MLIFCMLKNAKPSRLYFAIVIFANLRNPNISLNFKARGLNFCTQRLFKNTSKEFFKILSGGLKCEDFSNLQIKS